MHPSGTHVSGCRARARGGWRTALGRGHRSGISWPRIARTPALTACPRPPGARRAAAAGPRSGARPGEPAEGARAAGAREMGHGGPRVVRTGSEPPRAPARAPKRAPSRRCGLPPRAACSASFGACLPWEGGSSTNFCTGGISEMYPRSIPVAIDCTEKSKCGRSRPNRSDI